MKDAIRDRALALGFDAVGFAPASQGERAKAGLAAFLAAGRHGDMGWMAANADRRADPRTLWPEARSAVIVAMTYAPESDPLALLERPEHGAISVYARTARDYHDVLKGRLRQLGRWLAETGGCEVKLFVDTAPVMEKPLAETAGVGWQGKHTNLVSRIHGSWLFLGELLTTLEMEPDAAEAKLRFTHFLEDICRWEGVPLPKNAAAGNNDQTVEVGRFGLTRQDHRVHLEVAVDARRYRAMAETWAKREAWDWGE
jgi:epoxyqueuosine reductase